MKGGPSLVMVCWARCARCAGIRDFCPAFVALVAPSKNYFFPHRALFQLICPIAQKLRRQSCRVCHCLLI
jgi:hypothetical protein